MSTLVIAGMAGTAIAYGEQTCVPAPVSAPAALPTTAVAPSPEPTPAVPAAGRRDRTEPDPGRARQTAPVGAVACLRPTP